MRFSDAIQKFCVYLQVHKDVSIRTLEQYERHLFALLLFLCPDVLKQHQKTCFSHFLIFTNSNSPKNIQESSNKKQDTNTLQEQKQMIFELSKNLYLSNITQEVLDEFRLFLLQSQSRSQKTMNTYMISIRAFLKYMRRFDKKILSPGEIDLTKEQERKIEFLTPEEIQRLFFILKKGTLREKRDYAIIMCLYSTGLRISELVALNRDDIQLKTQEFCVRGKGGHIRIVYLTREATDAITQYLSARIDHDMPLFCSHNKKHEETDDILESEKKRLTRFFITRMVQEYARKAGILKKVSAHTLRHSFATTLLQNGADIRSIQELLGHKSILTTQVYTHVTNQKLKKVHEQFHHAPREEEK